MISYNADLTLREGLSEYLRRYDLGDGGYNNRWFTLPFLWIFKIRLPNIPSRVQAVKFHDLHHVILEYDTGYNGEAEIGAWEIASGCRKYVPAWILNMAAFAYGVLFIPIRTYRAFVRGRRSECLYHGSAYEQVLTQLVGEMRSELHIAERNPRGGMGDLILFVVWAILCFLPVAIIIVCGWLIIKAS